MSYYPQLAEAFSEMLASVANDRVFVLAHARPDGDCIGAQVALARILRSEGVEAVAANADPVPHALSFLDAESEIVPLDEGLLDGRSLVFVDCADEKRVGNRASEVIAGCNFLGNVDHHISNTGYAHINIVDAKSAATCEMLAGLAFDFGLEVDAQSAQALLTGIMTDTGRYAYEAATSRVFELSSRLVDCGARPVKTARALYEDEPLERLALLRRFLGNLRLECSGRLAIGKLSCRDFSETGASREHAEGFVEQLRSISGVKVGLYLEQREGSLKGSFRAEDAEFRVDEIARQFGGGGHACAAAFQSDESVDELEPKLLAAIQKRFESLG